MDSSLRRSKEEGFLAGADGRHHIGKGGLRQAPSTLCAQHSLLLARW